MTPPSLKDSSYRIRMSREDEIVRDCVVPRLTGIFTAAGRRRRSYSTALFYFLLNLLSLTLIDACARPSERNTVLLY